MKDITEKSISDLIYAESVEKPDELKKMKQKHQQELESDMLVQDIKQNQCYAFWQIRQRHQMLYFQK